MGALVAATIGLTVGQASAWGGVAAALATLLATGLIVRRAYRTGPHTAWEQARHQLAQGQAVVLWKPTCLFCERLLRAVGDDPRVTWVNVWADVDANRVVRNLNDGNELTPTALIGDAVLRNPGAQVLAAALGHEPVV